MSTDFDSLYAHYYRAVYARLRRLGVADDELDDLSQKIWLRVWRALPRVKHDQHLGAWLWKITTNIVKDAQRNRGYGMGHHDCFSLEGQAERLELTEVVIIDADSDPARFVPEREQLRDELRELARRMNARDQQVLLDEWNGNEPERAAVYLARRDARDMRRRIQKRMGVSA